MKVSCDYKHQSVLPPSTPSSPRIKLFRLGDVCDLGGNLGVWIRGIILTLEHQT
jgi:hypothetical protein